MKKLDQQFKERMRINAVVKELELEMAEQDYQNEKRNAAKEFEEKKVKVGAIHLAYSYILMWRRSI